MKYSPKEVKDINEKFNFNFKKKFGQNFIIDENIINKIVDKSNIDSKSLVVEIGPGGGSLTNKLSLTAKNVLCYEIDEQLKPILEEQFKNKTNVDVIYQDFLKANLAKDIEKYSYEKLYVIANLPYYITTPIIIKLIESKVCIDKIIVMVQKEVGERFSASIGSKNYGSLTVFLNYYFNISKIANVSRHVFIPVPNVDSVVVLFEPKSNLIKARNEDHFFELVRKSFRQKRKTLKNNLREYDLEIVEKVLEKRGESLNTRAEALPLDFYVELSNELSD